jgi:hypothetical protein
MDPAPRSFTELPTDPELGLPVPFACGTGEQDEGPASAGTLDKRRVTQCALSRVCGVCGAGLGRPVAFLGSDLEAGRNAFHFPPSHVPCAEQLLGSYAGVGAAVLGQDEPVDSWVLVTTAGFEFVRPGSDDADRRPTFQPNSLLEERRVG